VFNVISCGTLPAAKLVGTNTLIC